MKKTMIPLSKIRPGLFDVRSHPFRVRQEDTLKKRIKVTEFIEPIEVCQQADDGTYEIINGHGRYRAAKELGYSEIPAYVISETKLDRLFIRALTPNDGTSLDPIARTKFLVGYLEERFAENTEWINSGTTPEARTLRIAKNWESQIRRRIKH